MAATVYPPTRQQAPRQHSVHMLGYGGTYTDSAMDFVNWTQASSPATSSAPPPFSNTGSTLTTPIATSLDCEDFQTPIQPSHNYKDFKQQTGYPIGSIPELSPASNGNYPMFSSTGLDDTSMMGDASMMGDTWGMPMDVTTHTDISAQPGFMHINNNASQMNGYVNPSALTQDEIVPPRVYPGMHQHQAMARAARMQQQMAAQQQQMTAQQQTPPIQQQNRPQQSRRNGSHQATDPETEKIIRRVLDQVRQGTNEVVRVSQQENEMNGAYGHMARSKKDEEEMDPDAKLLQSEQGKALTPKERRQLRNKVSARTFRSRKKEYITTLEHDLKEAKAQVEQLKIENIAFQAMLQNVLANPNFKSYVEELDPAAVVNQAVASHQAASASARGFAVQDFNSISFQGQQLGSVSQPPTAGMGLSGIPEDLSTLALSTTSPAWDGVNPSFQSQRTDSG